MSEPIPPQDDPRRQTAETRFAAGAGAQPVGSRVTGFLNATLQVERRLVDNSLLIRLMNLLEKPVVIEALHDAVIGFGEVDELRASVVNLCGAVDAEMSSLRQQLTEKNVALVAAGEALEAARAPLVAAAEKWPALTGLQAALAPIYRAIQAGLAPAALARAIELDAARRASVAAWRALLAAYAELDAGRGAPGELMRAWRTAADSDDALRALEAKIS